MLQQSGAISKLAGLSFHKIQSVHGKTYKHQLYCNDGSWTRTAADTSYVLLSFTHTFRYISDKLHLPTNKK